MKSRMNLSLCPLLFLFLFPLSQARSQDLTSRFQYLTERNHTWTPRERVRLYAEEALTMAQALLESQGVLSTKWSLPDPDNPEERLIEVLEIVRGAQGSILNQLAHKLYQESLGLRMVYNPYLLMRSGAQAYFTEEGNILGIPHELILRPDPLTNISFQHELIHAHHFKLRFQGQSDPLHGTVTLLQGNFITRENQEDYTQFMGFEELETMAFALFRKARALQAIQSELKNTHGRDFHNKVYPLYAAARAGKNIALQTADVATRALEVLARSSKVSWEKHLLKVRQELHLSEREILKARLHIDAYLSSTRNGSNKVEDGVALELYFSADEEIRANQEILRKKLKTRLETLRDWGIQLRPLFESCEKLIGRNIADIIVPEKTLLDELLQKALKPWELVLTTRGR